MVVEQIPSIIGQLLTLPLILFLLSGLMIGLVFGAIPGVGGSLAMALILPLTLPFGGINALVLLVSIYCGAMYGGAISAILLNIPGTGGAAASTFEGYPLSKKGKSVYALVISAVSSAIGGVLSAFILILLTPHMIDFVLLFGTPEYLLIAVLGLAFIPAISQDSYLKGIFSATFGLLIATIGVTPMSSTVRYTFDILALYQGIDYIAVLLGLFAIGEMINLSGERGSIAKESAMNSGGLVGEIGAGFSVVMNNFTTLIKSSVIGVGIGSIPGAGSSVSNFVAYAEAVRSSDDSEEFGSGVEKGLIATESANNATVGGSLVPILSFGIPGSASSAIILGGMILHGLQPGPDLFTSDVTITLLLFTTVFICSIFILIFGLGLITRAEYLTRIDTDVIIPIIVVLSVVGGFSLNGNYMDVFTVLIFGIIGYFLNKYDYSVVAFLLGVILGPIVEENYYRSLDIGSGSYNIFIDSLLSKIIVALIVLVLLSPYLAKVYRNINGKMKSILTGGR